LIQFRVVNSGNQAILESDFNTNIMVDVDPNLEIVDYTITNSEPENLKLALNKTSKNRIEISPALINPGDSITFRIIVIGQDVESKASFHVDARIKDVKQITLLNTTNTPATNLLTAIGNAFLGALFTLSSLLGLLLLFIAIGSKGSKGKVKMTRRGWFVLVATIFILVLSLLLLFRSSIF
jgi:hypothetical protein